MKKEKYKLKQRREKNAIPKKRVNPPWLLWFMISFKVDYRPVTSLLITLLDFFPHFFFHLPGVTSQLTTIRKDDNDDNCPVIGGTFSLMICGVRRVIVWVYVVWVHDCFWIYVHARTGMHGRVFYTHVQTRGNKKVMDKEQQKEN